MLTEQLTADAAALHQAILRHGGEVSPFFCGKELGWEHRRIARAMEELVAAGIIDPAAAVLPKPLKQRKTYDFPEIQAILADFPAFARAVHAVEHAAGRRLPTADLSALTELFDFHGLSPEALELLTAQCCDEAILRGEERPTARRIEKLGLEWARPVSYTHLDVYKRQVIVSSIAEVILGAANGDVGVLLEGSDLGALDGLSGNKGLNLAGGHGCV